MQIVINEDFNKGCQFIDFVNIRINIKANNKSSFDKLFDSFNILKSRFHIRINTVLTSCNFFLENQILEFENYDIKSIKNYTKFHKMIFGGAPAAIWLMKSRVL